MLLWVPCSQSLDRQVLVAVVWVALFHSLLFLLGRVVADPCGKAWSDFQYPGYIEHIIENIRKLGWRLADSWLRLRVTSQLKLSADRLRGEHHLRSLAAWHGVGTSAVFVVRSCAFDWRHQT